METKVQTEIDADKKLLEELEVIWRADAPTSKRLARIEKLLGIDPPKDGDNARIFFHNGTAEFKIPSTWKNLHPKSWKSLSVSELDALLERLVKLAYDITIPMHKEHFDDLFLSNWISGELNAILKIKYELNSEHEKILLEKDESLYLFYKMPFNEIFHGEVFEDRFFYFSRKDVQYFASEFFESNDMYECPENLEKNEVLKDLYRQFTSIASSKHKLSLQQKVSAALFLSVELNTKKSRSYPLHSEVVEEFEKRFSKLGRFKAENKSLRSRRTELDEILKGLKPKTVAAILKEKALSLREIKSGSSTVLLQDETAEAIARKIVTFPKGTVIIFGAEKSHFYVLRDGSMCLDFFTEGSESESDNNVRGGIREGIWNALDRLITSRSDQVTLNGSAFFSVAQNSKTYGSFRLAIRKSKWLEPWSEGSTISIAESGGEVGNIKVRGSENGGFMGYIKLPDVTISLPYYLYIS